MVPPRLRHRIGIETLKRELQQANTLSSNNNSIHTQTLTVQEHWDGHDYLSVDWNSRYNYHQNGAVGDKIPGFRTSAGKSLPDYKGPASDPSPTLRARVRLSWSIDFLS